MCICVCEVGGGGGGGGSGWGAMVHKKITFTDAVLMVSNINMIIETDISSPLLYTTHCNSNRNINFRSFFISLR